MDRWVPPLFAAIPFLAALLSRPLARLLGTRPVGDGPLRRRIEGLAARAGVAVREVRLSRSKRGAMGRVLGLSPGTRCVVLDASLAASDALDDAEAVFAHELGHARRRHLLFTLLYPAALILAWPAIAGAARALAPGSGVPAAALILVLLLGGGIAWIGRRFEVEADLDAALWIGPERYLLALRPGGTRSSPLAECGGQARHDGDRRSSCRPASLARRRARIEALVGGTLRQAAFRAGGLRLRLGLVLVLAASLGSWTAWSFAGGR